MRVQDIPQWTAMAYRLWRVHGLVMFTRYSLYLLTAGRNGHWEWWLRDVVPERGRVAVDGGASFGQWSKFLATRFEKVCAFEPHLPTSLKLVDYDFPHVWVFPLALWSEPAQLDLILYPDSRVNRVVPHDLTYVIGQSKRTERVPAIALDQMGLHHVDFIKLDVEGAEVEALQGAMATITQCRPILLIELHSQKAKQVIDDILHRWGYIREYRHFPFYSPHHPMHEQRLWVVGRPAEREPDSILSGHLSNPTIRAIGG